MLPRWLVLLAAALATPAAAAPRLAIAPVKGDSRGDVGAQLVGALCAEYRCVPGVLDGSRSRLERAWKRGVHAALFSSVWREPGGRDLALALFAAKRHRPSQTWRLRLGRNGLLAPEQVDRLVADIDAALRTRRPRSPAPAPRDPDPPPYPAAREDARTAALPAGPVEPAAAALPTRAPPVPVVLAAQAQLPEAAPWVPAPAERLDDRELLRPWVALQAGVEMARSVLRFPAGGTTPLGYALAVQAMTHLRLEAYPLREVEGLTGAGLFAEAAYRSGIALPADVQVYRATFLRARAGALWWLHAGSSLSLAPTIAWEVERETVGPIGGVRLTGLPDIGLAGPSAGLDLELRPGWWRLALLASGRAAWWLVARELAGSDSFFPGGTAMGIRAEVGAALRLSAGLSLRALAGYGATFWWLQTSPSGIYSTRYARADSWAFRAGMRLEL